jgi:Ran GTPase-activating protein (RanGAP) involved in mRNA processing and transport
MNRTLMSRCYGSYDVSDLDWIVNACHMLKRNTWAANRPVFLDGSTWAAQFREDAAVCLLDAVRDNDTARNLIIRNVTMDLKAQRAFTEALDKNTVLQSISLTDLREAENQRMAIPVALFNGKNTALQELSLSNCLLDLQGAQALAGMLRKSKSLKSLKLRQVVMEQATLSCLVAALHECESLRQLSLNGMQWSGEELQSFFEAVTANKGLTVLTLEKMNLNLQSAPLLARLLRDNKNVTKLGLRRNDLTSDAVAVLVQDGLLFNQTLTELQLSCNPVGCQGAAHLIAGLRQNTTLRDLCLTRTEIWRPGCRAFVEALPDFLGLRKLSLDGNEMQDFGPEILVALQRNKVLYQIFEGLATFFKGNDAGLWTQVDLLLRMNKSSRRVLDAPSGVLLGLLPLVFQTATSQPDVLFCLLTSLPGTVACSFGAARNHRQNSSRSSSS